MSAKHKRPFYVFAAVAAVCCMVLFTGARGSKAEDGRVPVVDGDASVVDAGGTIAPDPDALESTTPGSVPGAIGDDGTGVGGDFDITTPSLDGSVTGADGEDAESGLIVLPPFDLPPPTAVDPDVTVPPVTDDTDGKGRGDRGGKKDKDKGKDEQGDEAEAEAEAEEEVDPDVYELPEGNEGDGEGDQADEPVDPGATP